MLERRRFLVSLAGACAASSIIQQGASAEGSFADYPTFLAGIKAQALAQGLPETVVTQALALTARPNAQVLKRDRHQPEFTMTWARYRTLVLPETRYQKGNVLYTECRAQLSDCVARFGADEAAVMAIWGIESNFGTRTGQFNVIDALATLAYDGRRAAFFRSELLKALQILAEGEIAPSAMTGSYAGAMGQVQFMPSAYLRYAVDGDGDGRKDIWSSRPDVFASIANYLGRCGWRSGENWGEEVLVPLSLRGHEIGRRNQRRAGGWATAGVRRPDGAAFSDPARLGAVVQPDGPGTQAFLVYHNFNVIRRYNPSDYYALAVGLLGNAVVSS